jgi:plasmid maintenance system killer protein
MCRFCRFLDLIFLQVACWSFKCPDTERLFHDENVRKFLNIRQPARRKLLMLHAAERLMDLRVLRVTNFINWNVTVRGSTV